jgi:hypothetical protein
MREGTDKCFNEPKGYSRLSGREVYKVLSLKDLLDEGLLSVGESLIWHKLNSGLPHEATILADGRIETADGKIHNSPSTAARHVNGGVSTNGWRVWRALDKNSALSEIRAASASYGNSEEPGRLQAPKSEI